MNTFFVSITEHGRLILDYVSHGYEIQRIQAKDYGAARLKVNTSGFYEIDGYGWFRL